MLARVFGLRTFRAWARPLVVTVLAGPAIAVGALSSLPARAKVPGEVHCYRKVCHRVKTLAETERMVGTTLSLRASYYDDPKVDPYNAGLLTSSGERFDAENAARAASSIFPDGTELLVWNPKNGRAAHVRVNDFGPFHTDRTLDITRGLAERLGLVRRGVANLSVTVIAAPPAREPRYRAFRTYPETKGYLGHYHEPELAVLRAGLVREARGLNPPLPEKAPRLARALAPQPKPWRRPAQGTVPQVHIAADAGQPSERVPAVAAPFEQRLTSGSLDVVIAIEAPPGAIYGPPAPRTVFGGSAIDRLRFAAAVLSAPVPAAAAPAVAEDAVGAKAGPATTLSYLLAAGMLAMISLLIAVVTRPMRVPHTPVRIAEAIPLRPHEEGAGRSNGSQESVQRAQTLIGVGLRLKGDVTSGGEVVIEGELEGNCHCRRLRVAETGRLLGDVVADEVIVAGTIVGDIRAQSLSAVGNATVSGKIKYGELVVDRAAEVNAVCRLLPRTPAAVTNSDVPKAA